MCGLIDLSCLVTSGSQQQHTPTWPLICPIPLKLLPIYHLPGCPLPHCASPQGLCIFLSWLLATQPSRTQGLSTPPVGPRTPFLFLLPLEPPLILLIPLCQCSQCHTHDTHLNFCLPLSLLLPSSGSASTSGLDTHHESASTFLSQPPPHLSANSAPGTEGPAPQPV